MHDLHPSTVGNPWVVTVGTPRRIAQLCNHTLDPINTRPKLLHAIQIGGVLLRNSQLQASDLCIAISNYPIAIYYVPKSYHM
jgi:hypothetical protein